MWSCIMPGLHTHLVKELNVSTVSSDRGSNELLFDFILFYSV